MTAPLFTFGIITDTHIRAPGGDLSSPYQVNELANDRARYATRLLKAQATEFVIHLGDMVHPLPGMPAYDDACAEALAVFKPLQPDLYFVAGNHDIGDKPMPGSPAAAVTDTTIHQYDKHFGNSYYAIEHKNCCFIIINSSLVNSGLAREEQQHKWLEKTLGENAERKCFVFSHYPLFLHDPDELEHYDNLAEPGRSRLLTLFRKFKPQVVFSGHVHQFFFNVDQQTSYYTLPPTSFTRQDYAELFNAPPAAQFGRDDEEKYSVAIVEVYADSHRVLLLPTHGQQLSDSTAELTENCAMPVTPKDLIVSLRHAWHKSIDLPYNGPMEEFSRKRVRNDYGLLRLQQMGVSNVRVPMQDLVNATSRQRIEAYATQGICSHVFCTQHQLEASWPILKQYNHLVSSFECVLPNDSQHWRIELLAESATAGVSCPLKISYACSGAHAIDPEKPFAHTVSTGFEWSDQAMIFNYLAQHNYPCDQVVFQIPWEQPLQPALTEMQNTLSKHNLKGVVNLRLSPSNPADSNFDDTAIVTRLEAALEQINSTNNLQLMLDTFEDIDRGYSPRYGLVDRLYNLRAGGRLLMEM